MNRFGWVFRFPLIFGSLFKPPSCSSSRSTKTKTTEATSPATSHILFLEALTPSLHIYTHTDPIPNHQTHPATQTDQLYHYPDHRFTDMENFSDFNRQEVEEDALSFCDLPLHDEIGESEENPMASASYSSDPDAFFEFPVDPIRGYIPVDVVFCGKPIDLRNEEPQIENPFFSRSESFKFSSPSHPHSHRSESELVSCRSHSPSSNSRKHKVLIGLVKYQPEMDMNEIRKRQGRRTPALMFPVISGGELASVGGRSGSGKGHWRLMRALRCRFHLLNALAKATLGCMPRV